MKKIIYVLLAFSFLVLFTGCDNSKDTYLKDLSYKELEEKVNNNEEFFFVVTRDGCSHCEEFIPVLEKVLNDFPLELLQEVKIACPNDTMLREIFDNKHSELEREMEHLQMALTVWKW